MTIRFPLPSIDRWSNVDGDFYAIVSAPSGERWSVIAHLADGSTRELPPASGTVSGYVNGGEYDSKTDQYWDIEYVDDAVDFEIRRPDSDPVLVSQLWKLNSENEAKHAGWATSMDVAADLATRNLVRDDREVKIRGIIHTKLGDVVEFWDGLLHCQFHHFFDASEWQASPGGWSRRCDDLGVSVQADTRTVADAIETYIRNVLWAAPGSQQV